MSLCQNREDPHQPAGVRVGEPFDGRDVRESEIQHDAEATANCMGEFVSRYESSLG